LKVLENVIPKDYKSLENVIPEANGLLPIRFAAATLSRLRTNNPAFYASQATIFNTIRFAFYLCKCEEKNYS